MSCRRALAVLVLIALASPAHAALQTAGALALGADGGVGGESALTVNGLAQDFPFAARITVGWHTLDPGNAPLARQVFVNNATNGSPESNGHRWDFRLDARYPIQHGRLKGAWLVFGPRLSLFKADFNFVDGNEEFFVTTNQVGFGGGLEHEYPINAHTTLLTSVGLDWYANGTFVGHGSSYAPNGMLVDPKANFGYMDADKAISQPQLAPRFMIGIQRPLGR